MTKYLFKSGILLIVVTLLSLTAYFKFYHHHLNIPEGCDEFGYLYMADAISKGTVFQYHSKRSFTPELINYLEGNGNHYRDYAWLIAPHAYHVEKTTKKIINQYPPGTSLILSFFKKENRQVYFPVVTVFIFAFFPLLAILILSNRKNEILFGINLVLLFLIIALVSSPFMNELHRINSVAPTYGLILAAGLLLKEKPYLSLFLVGISVVFRIPNILLSVPILGYIGLSGTAFEVKNFPKILKKSILGFFILIGATSIYFYYVYHLLGNPLLPTYSELDQRVVGLKEFLSNFLFYFDFNKKWFLVNIIPLVLILIFAIKKRKDFLYFLTLIGIPLINYIFYLLHGMQNQYYPYASGVFLVGALLNIIWATFNSNFTRQIIYFFLLMIITTATLVNSNKVWKNIHINRYQTQTQSFEKCFGDVDVVWAELRSSTVEYALHIAGFRYFWGPEATRTQTMQWLTKNKYQQAVWMDDLNLTNLELEKYLNSTGIPYHIRTCDQLGTIYLLK